MKRFEAFILFFLIVMMGCPSFAEQPASNEPQPAAEQTPAPEGEKRPNKIVEIEVRGNQIISTATILGKVKSQKDEVLVQEVINEDVKRLYATGYFQDIRMELEEQPEGYKVIIVVDEKPVIKEILIEGAIAFKEEKLRKELKVLEGQILDRKAVKAGVETIRKLYGDKGFRFVTIDSEVKVENQTREATVIVRIVEGEKYKIKKLDFTGVTAFKKKKLTKLMKTKPDKWYTSGVFKEANFQKDLEKIQLFYQQEGYLDVKVSPSFEYDQASQKIFITIAVDEGKHYVTGEIKIEGNKLFPESEIWQQLEMLPGQTYSQYYLASDIEKIRDYYYERGYMDARIIPDMKLNRDSGKVDLTYEIQEGDLYFVEKVMIRGNTKTKDMVIRRELRIRPGERFDGEKIQKSKQRLENLGFFDEITYDTEPSANASNRKDLIFRVKEKRTGELSFGGGISSVESFIAFGEIAQRNFDLFNWPRFTGGGQSVSFRAQVGSINKDFTFSFVEPYLFNKPVSLGVDLYDSRRNNRNVDFDEDRLGAAFTLSKLFRDVLRVGTGYTLERVKVTDVSDDAPSIVRLFEGKNWLSRLKLFTSYDTRDNVFNPTKGLLAGLNGELVGSFLGGDQDYYILQTNATKYWTIFKKHVIEVKGRLGAAQEFGDSEEVPIFDRFYAGGLGTVRGYDVRRVGPKESGNSIGGETIAILNLEYTFPVPYLDAFRGAVFIDAGEVNRNPYRLNFSDFAVSVGPGIKIKTPIGPVAFYYGYPIANRDTENRNGRFEFSLSRGF
ncbi:MAG: outer membrane protein assembly factor BamA [Candidatus Omnitrophica bacterium]|nr:outer membrane protein assembly factor BamA [Candidatus Omnitrophota bacterium]